MGILSNRRRGRKQWSSIESQRKCKYSNNNTIGWYYRQWRRSSNRSYNKFLRLIRYEQHGKFHNIRTRGSLSIHPDIQWSWYDKSNNNSKNDNNRKRNRFYKYVYAITTLCSIITPSGVALAESVGGVSATANPIANSSGSVTNQAIQVLQGPYVTNTYGNQISCQGPTANFTPYIQYSNSWKDPFERVYHEPQYNNTDFTGRTTQQTVTVKNYPWEDWYDTRTKADGSRWFEDGADMQITVDVDGPDGIPDNPGQVVWEKPMRTDMTANNNFNLGLSATLSLPLDKKLQNLCKEAATTQIGLQQQLTANKRLDFEIARLKNCGELMKAGIMFHPQSPYASICADVVVVQPAGQLIPHNHQLPRPKFEENQTEVKTEANGTAEDLTPMSIGNPLSSSQPASSASPSSHDSSQKELEGDLSSSDTHSSESHPESNDKGFFQGWRLPWSKPSSQPVSQPSAADQLGVLQVGQMKQPQTQSQQ